MKKLISHNRQVLTDCLKVLQALNSNQYRLIGANLRHLLDHYSQFLTGLPLRSINYDDRARDVHLEKDIALARQETIYMISQLGALDAPEYLSNQRVEVFSRTSTCDASVCSQSSIPRELQFLHSHTVHHLAAIKQVLDYAGVNLDEGLGVAPSTFVHRSAYGLLASSKGIGRDC